jgi:hypothetical protein
MSSSAHVKKKQSMLGKRKNSQQAGPPGYESTTKSQKLTEAPHESSIGGPTMSHIHGNLEHEDKVRNDRDANGDDEDDEDTNVKWKSLEHHGVR